jgi:hypothetical protein
VDAELLLMDMVDDADNGGRPARQHRREERDAILAVDHGVEASPVAGEEGRGVDVQRVCATTAFDTYAIDHRMGWSTAVAGGHQGHLGAAGGEAAGDLPAEDLGATGLRVGRVPPVQEQHPGSGQAGDLVTVERHPLLVPPTIEWECCQLPSGVDAGIGAARTRSAGDTPTLEDSGNQSAVGSCAAGSTGWMRWCAQRRKEDATIRFAS